MYRSTPAARLLPLALLAAVACSRPCVVVAELSSVRETIDHPDADDMVISAVPVTEMFTKHAYVDVFHLRGGGRKTEEHREYWVMPLVDPGSTDLADGTVYAWVMNSGPKTPQDDHEAWIENVSQVFNGTPTRVRVLNRIIDRGRGHRHRMRGIGEAERAHNLKSHSNTPIFVVR